ncbi:MAG TPA: tetratricopeptide repeat protein [Bryobacteraceae bacterium]|nr:tetratricopeptide repeat protein [Bryobacteraceae bacterium]
MKTHHTALLLLLLVPASLPAQRRGGGGGRGQAFSNLVLRGSVLLPDGVVPHRIVRVERICGGRTSGTAFTDSKGHYSFDLDILFDPMTGVVRSQDPGATGKNTAGVLAACSIRASMEGFRGNAIEIAPLVKARKTEAPPIQLEPVARDQNVILSITDASAGPAAKKDFDKGLDLVSQGKFHDAIKAMEKAASEEPKFATAWLSLGMLQVSQQDLPGAMKSYAKAIEADEHLAAPYIELAVLETEAPDWAKVAEHSSKAIALDPDSFPRAYYLNTMANIRLHKTAEALKSSTEGISVDPDHAFPDLEYMQGMLLISTGDKTRGRAQLQSYLDLAPNGDNVDNAKAQLAK